MAYILPRAVIVLIAWGTICLIVHTFTNIDPLVFYIAGGVWSLVGLVTFSYMDSLPEQPRPAPVRAIASARALSE